MRSTRLIKRIVLAVMLGCVLGRVDARAEGRQSPPASTSMWAIKPEVVDGIEPAGSAEMERARSVADPSLPPTARKAFEFVIAPIPLINPTLENGGALVVGGLYPLNRQDTKSPPSASFAMAMKTSNGSAAYAVGQSLHIHGDRFRVLAGGGYADLNFQFFGIGASAGQDGESVELNQKGYGGMAELLLQMARRWYGGVRYRAAQTTISADFNPAGIPVPVRDLALRTALLGPHVQRDSRDNEFFPTRGSLFDVMALVAGEAIGGNRRYESSQVSLSSYVSLSERQVMASRVTACASTGDVPFYDLCLIGQLRDLRGYPTGQFRDRRLVSGQAEYRLHLWWRMGLALFAGAGEVAERFDAFNPHDVLPSGGAGLRFRLTRENPVNLRVDYAWGQDSQALYISVGEAF